MEVTEKQLHILRHSLGLDDRGHGRQYRNYFVTGPGSSDFEDCKALCAAGLMADAGEQVIFGGDHCFHVTYEGKECVLEHKEPEKNLTRGQKRYQMFLAADCGMRFGDWLRCRANYSERRQS